MALIKLPLKAASSNKKDLTQKIPIEGQNQATTQADDASLSETPKPFIDKLTVNLTFKSAKKAYETHGALYRALTNDSDFFKSVGNPAKGFKLAKQIVVQGCESSPRLDYAYSENPDTGVNLAGRIRLEFNPSKLGIWGLKLLHGTLSSIVEDGWRTFVKDARISRLDVAVDLVGVRITKLKIVPPKAVVSQTWSSSKGKLQTYQWGKPTGSYTQIYNKTEEMKARGKEVSGSQVTRFERRLKQPACQTLTKLVELDNPFAGFVLTTTVPTAPDDGPGYVWPLFCDSVSVRGLHAALQLLPEHKRPVYKKKFANVAPSWWDPEVIWAQWPGVIQEMKIGDPQAWT